MDSEKLKKLANLVRRVQPDKKTRNQLAQDLLEAADEIARLRSALRDVLYDIDSQGQKMLGIAKRRDLCVKDDTPWTEPGYVSEWDRAILEGEGRAYRSAARRFFGLRDRHDLAMCDADGVVSSPHAEPTHQPPPEASGQVDAPSEGGRPHGEGAAVQRQDPEG